MKIVKALKSRRLFLVLVVLAAFLVAVCSACCAGSAKNEKTLLNYYTESPVVSARFFLGGPEGITFQEELKPEDLDAFIQKTESMTLKYHLFHTDYFWGGQYGIEYSLEDGTFLTYDGTKLCLRNASVKEDHSSESEIKGDFLEVTNCEFWAEMAAFFPSVNGTLWNAK